jgi:hypothetical protein
VFELAKCFRGVKTAAKGTKAKGKSYVYSRTVLSNEIGDLLWLLLEEQHRNNKTALKNKIYTYTHTHTHTHIYIYIYI